MSELERHPKNRSCERTEEVLENFRKRMMDAERLLANGQRVEWCELHNTIGASYGCRFGREDDCRMIPKLLSAYPKGAFTYLRDDE